MSGQFQATLELVSRDAATLNFSVTVIKDKGQPDNAIIRVVGDDGFTHYEALPVLSEGANYEFATGAPSGTGEAFLWLWPDTTTPVSNTVAL